MNLLKRWADLAGTPFGINVLLPSIMVLSAIDAKFIQKAEDTHITVPLTLMTVSTGFLIRFLKHKPPYYQYAVPIHMVNILISHKVLKGKIQHMRKLEEEEKKEQKNNDKNKNIDTDKEVLKDEDFGDYDFDNDKNKKTTIL